jgi:iron complex outermembrane receptor protein
MSVAFGAQYEKDKYTDSPKPILQVADIIGGAGNQPEVQGDRKVSAAFVEMRFPIVQSLETSIAARYDHYSDFGNTVNPKATVRWQPSSQWLVRGSAGTGFRAPTLPDLFTPFAITNAGGAYDDPFFDSSTGPGTSRCNDNNGAQFDPRFCNAQLAVAAGTGNPNLKPERSRQASVGMLFEPTRNVSLGVDYFWIKQKNLIGLILGDTKLIDFIGNFNPVTQTSSSIYSPDVKTRFDPTVNSTVINYVDVFFQNVADQITTGLDFSARFRAPPTPLGTFNYSYEGTYLVRQQNRTTVVPGQDWVDTVGDYAIFGPVQRYKHLMIFGWDSGAWDAALSYNLSSGYNDQNPGIDGLTHKVGNYEIWGLLGRYKGVKDLTITLGVRNLFDRDPPKSNQNQYFQVGYDPTYTDPRGRTYYVKVQYKFL